MTIHFNETRAADAPAATLWEVITPYADYPKFNSAIVDVRVARQDEGGAEFVADRKTRIGKTVRAYDRYAHEGRDLVLERTYEGNASARSTWVIHPVDAERSTLTIDATQGIDP